MSGLEENVWSYDAEKWVDILLHWVEFLRRRGFPSTTTLRNIVVCLPVTKVLDRDVQKVQQLVDLLLQRVPTRCPVETIQSLELEFVKRVDMYRPGLLFVLDDSHDTTSDELCCSMIRHCCCFCQNLPLNIAKISCKSQGYHPQAQAQILSALSENRHLTELTIDAFSPILTDQLIPRNPLLATLTMYDPGATSEKASILMRSVFNGKTSRLRTFTYANDWFRGIYLGASELDVEAMALLKCNTHLEQLFLEGHQFGDEGAILIAEVLTVNKSLRNLIMNQCDIGDRGCMALCEALEVNDTLESLDLRGNSFGDECAQSFVSALQINRTLRTLGIDNSFVVAKLLLISDTQLQHICRMHCGEAEASLLAESLTVNKSLKSLEFSYGRVGDQGCIALAKALQVNTTLEKLILDHNQIRKAGIEALASALHINNTLRHLSLDDNRFGDAGASLLAEALTVNKGLKSLEMNYCYIGDPGCKTLARALQVNNTLEKIALNSHNTSIPTLGDEGVRAFFPTLRVNRSLQHLEIRGGSLPAKEMAAELLHVMCHFLCPVWISITKEEEGEALEGSHLNAIAPLLMRLRCASLFNCDFDKKCRQLWDGTVDHHDHASFRWFLPFLRSTHPFVKQTVLFLLLRQSTEDVSQSLKLLLRK